MWHMWRSEDMVLTSMVWSLSGYIMWTPVCWSFCLCTHRSNPPVPHTCKFLIGLLYDSPCTNPGKPDKIDSLSLIPSSPSSGVDC